MRGGDACSIYKDKPTFNAFLKTCSTCSTSSQNLTSKNPTPQTKKCSKVCQPCDITKEQTELIDKLFTLTIYEDEINNVELGNKSVLIEIKEKIQIIKNLVLGSQNALVSQNTLVLQNVTPEEKQLLQDKKILLQEILLIRNIINKQILNLVYLQLKSKRNSKLPNSIKEKILNNIYIAIPNIDDNHSSFSQILQKKIIDRLQKLNGAKPYIPSKTMYNNNNLAKPTNLSLVRTGMKAFAEAAKAAQAAQAAGSSSKTPKLKIDKTT